MTTFVDIENNFSNFVRRFGGQVISDSLGASPDHPNADYYFPDQQVIAELKCFEDDKREDKRLQAKVQALFDSWMADGTIPTFYGPRVTVSSKELPVACQRALAEIYKVPIQRRVQKANKQIKATAQKLRLNSYQGLLLLANDGNYALEADMILYLVWRILGTSFQNITNVVYFTVNMPARSPLSAKPCLLWAGVKRSHLECIDSTFISRLGSGWIQHFQELIGEPVEEIHLEGIESLAHLRHDP